MKSLRSSLFCSALLLATSPLASAQQADAPYVWNPVKLVAGGYISGYVYHPAQKGLAYIRTDIGGAYRRDNDNTPWIPLNDWIGADDKNSIGIESLAIDPEDPTRLYVAVGEYTQSWSANAEMLRSDDQGRTFKRIPLPFKCGSNEDGRGSGERLVVDPHHRDTLYLGTRHDGLWRSTDRAATWSKVASFPSFADNGIGIIAELFAPSKATALLASTIYVAVSAKDGGLFRSTDSGQTWTRIPKQPSNLLITNMAISADGDLYLTYGNAPGPMNLTQGSVWHLSVTSGEWNEITPLKPAFHWKDGATTPTFGYGGVAVSAGHPSTLLVSTLDRWDTGDGIFRSTDGGLHWQDIADPQEPRSTTASPWLRHETPTRGTGSWPTTLAIDPFDPNTVSFGTGETLWRTHDANGVQQGRFVHWSVDAAGIEETSVLALYSPPDGPHLISALGDIGGFRHDDFHVSPRAGSFKNPELASTTAIAFAPQTPRLMVRVGHSWLGTTFGAVSLDQGLTWMPFSSQPPNTKGSGQVILSADAKVIVWAGESAPIAVSRDLGSTWTVIANLPQQSLLAADPINPTKLYAYAPDTGNLYISIDAGATFSPQSTGLPKPKPYERPAIYATPGRESDLWLSSELGLYHSSSTGVPFSAVPGVEGVHALGFGKASAAQAGPTLWLSGRIHGLSALYTSTDTGRTWSRIDDDHHRYGEIRAITGDPRIAGRVYIGSEGRGILYGDPAPKQ